MSRDQSMIDRLVRASEPPASEDPRAATFLRGVVVGALVGAAIAGSTIWQRRHAQGRPEVSPEKHE